MNEVLTGACLGIDNSYFTHFNTDWFQTADLSRMALDMFLEVMETFVLT